MRGPTCSFEKYAAIVAVSASWSLQVHQREWAERVCGRQTTWSHQRGWASGICVRFASDHHGSSGQFRKCSGRKIWAWVNTYRYIFSGMNIHLPAILGFTRYQGFDPSPYKDTILFRDSKPSQLLILGVISPKKLTDQPFFGNDGIRRVRWISGLWGVFCWNIPCSHWDWSKLLRWTLLPTDHLGSISLSANIPSYSLPSVVYVVSIFPSYWWRLLYFLLLVRLQWYCPSLSWVISLAGRCVTLALTRAGTSFDLDDPQSSQEMDWKWINPSKSLAKASEVGDFRISNLCQTAS